MPQGGLFTHYFLGEGIRETPPWRALADARIAQFRADAVAVFQAFPHQTQPNEAETENRLIWEILALLGYESLDMRQQNLSAKGREAVPDGLLFADAASKAAASARRDEWERYRDGVCIVESKRWERALDRKDALAGDNDVPSTQMLRYLRRVDDITRGTVRFGILTNGRHWRLYFQGAKSVSEDFLELDLPVLLRLDGFQPDESDGDPYQPFADLDQYSDHWLRVFMLLFGREAFLPEPDGRTFHAFALDEGRLWEQRVADDLSEVVFEKVFPELVGGLAASDPDRPDPPDRDWLDDIHDAALTLLYRLLFVLYAGDRNLLPVRESSYDDYGIHRTVRDNIARRRDEHDVFAETGDYYQTMRNLFHRIGAGDENLDLPKYNGRLFDAGRVPVLERAVLPDSVFAHVIDALSRVSMDGERRNINYRDLSVRQLGSIYERLLEYKVVVSGPDDSDSAGGVAIQRKSFARKGSGSYYTPDDLVRLIIERTMKPLLREIWAKFKEEVGKRASERGLRADRLKSLAEHDPAARFLDLKVCDPAMGSGHFLVDTVDYMADRILDAMAEAKQVAAWAKDYESPVAASIADIRARILEQAERHNWSNIKEDRLDDRQIVRRMILKRVIYGVDKNPMAVELAKVSLWLHTFTAGAPLSFLDHHLRAGDSLFGEFVRPVADELASRRLFIGPSVQKAMGAEKGMMAVEQAADADIAEVRTSEATFDGVRDDIRPLARLLGLVHAFRWLAATGDEAGEARKTRDAFLEGALGDPMSIAMEAAGAETTAEAGAPAGDGDGKRPEDRMRGAIDAATLRKHLDAARRLDAEQGFLHWEAAFPGVWTNWESDAPQGGFDAVIGNPPWDRIKLQQVEWFADRRKDIAHAQRAADRKKMIAALKRDKDPLWDDFTRASILAETAAAVARLKRGERGKEPKRGDYPLLSGGDINLYSLFVERAMSLIKPDGMVGLLVPSGIASDKNASRFFKKISTGGRLASLLDFENKKVFFPAVDSRFKFCAIIFGGPEQNEFDQADCGFFFHSVADIDDAETGAFTLGPDDFAAVNPNTATAPIFRTRRDAEITKAVYARVPVLADRRAGPPETVFPVKYYTMFHMTNDSSLFRTAEQLEQDGAYPVAGNLWKKGDTEYVPLYEGKMVQAYDHRAASVEVDHTRLHRPGQPVSASIDQHQDPAWQPKSQYYVKKSDLRGIEGLPYMIGYKRISAPTNIRSFIACVVPPHAMELNLSLIVPDTDAGRYPHYAPLLLANMNAFVFDFVVRQKLQGQTLNWYIVEQLPVLPDAAWDQRIGKRTARDMVREEVLKLTYTSRDMTPFARDMGYEGEPFVWDEDARRDSRARLDALCFRLYGLGREDADYILSTFPIVERQDRDRHGQYLTRDLILGYMAAFDAGDTDSRIVPRDP